MSMSELPTTIIRGGTSRGVFLCESDLPSDPVARSRAILRLFGGESAILADGLGGENPVLRKTAIVAPAAPANDGSPRVRYTFGQVDAELRSVQHAAECGNIAAGVPAFSVLQGWAPAPRSGATLWIELVNTGSSVVAEWLDTPTSLLGRVRLGFVAPAENRASALHGRESPAESIWIGARTVRYSVVRAINDYLFVDSRSLGMERPSEARELSMDSYQTLCDLMTEVESSLPGVGALKVCLVAPSPSGRGAIDALIAYPRERRLHGSLAVTGAIALGVASCVRGTVPWEQARLGKATTMDISHKSGTLSITLERGSDEIPVRVGVERTYRVLMRGVAL